MSIASVLRPILLALSLFLVAGFAAIPSTRAAGLLKLDQTDIDGRIVGFDGKQISIQTGSADNRPVVEQVPLTDVIRVRFTGGSARTTPARVPTGTAIPPAAAGARPPAAGAQPAPVLLGSSRVNPPLVPPPPPPGPIVLPATWHLRSVQGDFIEGRIRSWTQQQLAFDSPQNGISLHVSTSGVAELWRAAPDLVRKAHDLKVQSDSEDVAFVIREREIVAVKGVALGIDGEALTFRYDGEDRKINVARLLGVVLVRPEAVQPTGAFYQSAILTGGRLLGRWQGMENGVLKFQTLLGPVIQLPEANVISIENRNGRVVYLSDLKPTKVEQTPYFDRLMPYRSDTTLNGSPLRVGGVEMERGIAVHSRCVLEYDLGGAFEEFHTAIGFEQPQGLLGRATVRVLLDGQKSFENLDLRGDQTPVELAGNVKGVKRLTLEVDFGLNEDVGDRIIWGNARLTRAEVAK